jgi:YD repeat-containing protein
LTVPQLTYNASNELVSTSNSSFTYDRNGNMLTKTNTSGATQYAWDFENRLSSVTLPGSGGKVTFEYDPFGRRVQKTFWQGTTANVANYLYDGANSVEEVNGGGNLIAGYVQSPVVDEPLAEVRSSTPAFYEQESRLCDVAQ